MGAFTSIPGQWFPSKSKFGVGDIPDLTGKVAIVTGGNNGIGYETVKALLEHNAKVYMASRSEEKATAAIKKLAEETGKECHFLKLDLADLSAVKQAASQFKTLESELHILINNAGVLWTPINELTVDGYDLQFGVNVIGHYVFTIELLPVLRAGAASSGDKARVVNVSSWMHILSGISYDAIKDTSSRKWKTKYLLYCQSKTGNIVLASALNEKYGKDGIVFTSTNPGHIKTDLQRHTHPALRFILSYSVPWFGPNLGCLTQLWAAVAPETADMGGKYLVPWARVGEPLSLTSDPKVGNDLIEWMEKETGVSGTPA